MANLAEKTAEEIAAGARTAEAYKRHIETGGVASEFGSQVPGPNPQAVNPVQVPGTPAAAVAVTLAGTPAAVPPAAGGPAVAVLLGLTGPTGVVGSTCAVAPTGVTGPTFGPIPTFLRKIEGEIEAEFKKL